MSRNLSNKYGKEYSESAASNREQQVNARLATSLSLDRPAHSQLYKVMRAACDMYQIDWNDQHWLELITQVEGPDALAGHVARNENKSRDSMDESKSRDQEPDGVPDRAELSEDEDALMAELNAYQSTRNDTRQSVVDMSDLPDVPEPDFDEPAPEPVTSKRISPPSSGPSSTSSRQSVRSTPVNPGVTRVNPSTEEDLDLFASNFPQVPATKTNSTRSTTTNSTPSTSNAIVTDEDDDLEAKLPRVKTDPRDKKRDSGAGLNDDDLIARFQALKKK